MYILRQGDAKDNGMNPLNLAGEMKLNMNLRRQGNRTKPLENIIKKEVQHDKDCLRCRRLQV